MTQTPPDLHRGTVAAIDPATKTLTVLTDDMVLEGVPHVSAYLRDRQLPKVGETCWLIQTENHWWAFP